MLRKLKDEIIPLSSRSSNSSISEGGENNTYIQEAVETIQPIRKQARMFGSFWCLTTVPLSYKKGSRCRAMKRFTPGKRNRSTGPGKYLFSIAYSVNLPQVKHHKDGRISIHWLQIEPGK